MKILFVTPYLPSPPRSGGPRRLHGLISGLSRLHSVSVLSLVEPGEEQAEFIRATRQYCAEVVPVENEHYGLPTSQKRALQLKSLVSPSSYERMVYHRPALQAALDQMFQRSRYDVINVEFSQMAYYRFPRTAKLVLDEHNIEYDILYRTYLAERGLGRKLYNYVDYLKLRREERRIWRKFDGCTLTSVRDEQLLRRDYPALPTTVVPNAVDTTFFRPGQTAAEPMTILFFGAIDYYPNTDGLLFFLRDVMPQVKERFPSVKLLVVGQSPPEIIRRWASDNVIITGLVDDVRPYLERASAVIVPLRIGGGTRLKIVEALAMGKAVVSTRLGAEGIDVTDERDILLADTAEAFARQVGRLLDNGTLVHRLGRAARLLAESKYDWQAAVRKLEDFYEALFASSAVPFRPDKAALELDTRVGSWK